MKTKSDKILKSTIRKRLFDLAVAGQLLSNIAFNYKQDTNRPEAERDLFKEAQERWDKAREKLPRWVHCA